MPSSFQRLEIEYAAIPKIPVTASIAANIPMTPRLMVATRAGKIHYGKLIRPAANGEGQVRVDVG